MTSSIEIAQYLISQGINVNAQDKYGESVLMIALKQSEFCDKRKEFIQLLLDNGAEVNLKNYRNIAPIDIAPELIHSLKK
jgi:ankyrin repeat protein